MIDKFYITTYGRANNQITADKFFSVKEPVFPFKKFQNVDVIRGPEMKSTGEVMGIDRSFEKAFAKSQFAAGINLPLTGTAFLSVKDSLFY